MGTGPLFLLTQHIYAVVGGAQGWYDHWEGETELMSGDVTIGKYGTQLTGHAHSTGVVYLWNGTETRIRFHSNSMHPRLGS